MSEIEIRIIMPSQTGGRAAVRERWRDIAGRGYDERSAGLVDEADMPALWQIIARAKRQGLEADKAARVAVLLSELKALTGGDA